MCTRKKTQEQKEILELEFSSLHEMLTDFKKQLQIKHLLINSKVVRD